MALISGDGRRENVETLAINNIWYFERTMTEELKYHKRIYL